jgi:hypothetical protein
LAKRIRSPKGRDEDTSRGGDTLFAGLEPSGLELLTALSEIGLLRPIDGRVPTATKFEMPRLYRPGLGVGIGE